MSSWIRFGSQIALIRQYNVHFKKSSKIGTNAQHPYPCPLQERGHIPVHIHVHFTAQGPIDLNGNCERKSTSPKNKERDTGSTKVKLQILRSKKERRRPPREREEKKKRILYAEYVQCKGTGPPLPSNAVPPPLIHRV